MTRYLTTTDVARLAGVQEHQLVYAMRTGRVFEPIRIGGRRVFTVAEAQAIQKFFNQKRSKNVR
jgi:hypothetical protein